MLLTRHIIVGICKANYVFIASVIAKSILHCLTISIIELQRNIQWTFYFIPSTHQASEYVSNNANWHVSKVDNWKTCNGLEKIETPTWFDMLIVKNINSDISLILKYFSVRIFAGTQKHTIIVNLTFNWHRQTIRRIAQSRSQSLFYNCVFNCLA